MIRPIALLTVLAALSTAACAGSTADDATAAGAGAVSTNASFSAKIKGCDSAHSKSAENAASTYESVEAEGTFQTCIATAIDAAVPVIEGILKENESGSAGSVKGAIAQARQDNESLCAELSKTSENFGGTLQRIEDSGCSSERERFLAAILSDMVDFPNGKIEYIKDDRAHHAACYKAYDAAPADSTAEMVQVNVDLNECIQKEITVLTDGLAQTEIDNDETAGPLATAKARVAAAVAAKIQSTSALCGTISQAGENGIGTLSRVSSAACTVRVHENAYTFLSY